MTDREPVGRSGVSTTTVIRAIYDLDGAREPVTAEQVAAYLETTVKVVKPLLNELRNSRIMRSRQRQGRIVWEPWR